VPGTYFQVEVRYPGEWLDIKELVQPESYAVKMALAKVYNSAQTPEQNIWNCWDLVCREIDYPPAGDYHRREAFPTQGLFGRPLVSQSTQDFWSFPFETLSLGIGDCEDSSILLCSMLRNFRGANEVDVTIGYYDRPHPSLGHAWVTIIRLGRRYILEPTLGNALPTIYQVPEAAPYLPYIRFNDMLHTEERPGFVLGPRDKRLKHERMRELYG
jgi:hypothetical protein